MKLVTSSIMVGCDSRIPDEVMLCHDADIERDLTDAARISIQQELFKLATGVTFNDFMNGIYLCSKDRYSVWQFMNEIQDKFAQANVDLKDKIQVKWRHIDD